jgi:serine/threonine protein phosphatase 1
VLEVLTAKPGSTCVMGNHDYALVRAARLDDGEASAFWMERYASSYDHAFTFESYLGYVPKWRDTEAWPGHLADLKAAMPPAHRELFAGLPWIAEATGHLFLHCGLSPDLDCPAQVQVECAHRKLWDRAVVNPRYGSRSDRLFSPHYPVWLGADRKAAVNPLPYPGKVQVLGHEFTRTPDVSPVRIRIDTSGGTREPLTACLLPSPTAEPIFITSSD